MHSVPSGETASAALFGRLTGKQKYGNGPRSGNDYMLIYNWLNMSNVTDPDGSVIRYADAICESGRMHFLASKCRYYKEKVAEGEIDRPHAVNIFRKILSEDFGMEI